MNKAIFSVILMFLCCFAAFAQTAQNTCPEIKLISPQGLIDFGRIVNFSVQIDEKTDKSGLHFEWKVSKGKIIQGQGNSEIVYLADDSEGEKNHPNESNEVEISVKIDGLPSSCSNNSFSEKVKVNVYEPIGCIFIERFGKISLNDYKARLDNFYIAINNSPVSEGLINLKFDKRDSRAYKINLLKQIVKLIEFRRYDIKRITFAISEDEKKEETSLPVLQSECDILEFANKNSIIIKGEDLKKSINNLFPKK